jgi:hypothetical protein
MTLPLQRLPERPFRTLPGGILRKFPRRLGQFPLSFLAKSRWAPRSSGELRSRAYRPASKSPANKKQKGDRPLSKPVALTLRHVQWATPAAIALEPLPALSPSKGHPLRHHTKLRLNRRVRSFDPEALDGSTRGGVVLCHQ